MKILKVNSNLRKLYIYSCMKIIKIKEVKLCFKMETFEVMNCGIKTLSIPMNLYKLSIKENKELEKIRFGENLINKCIIELRDNIKLNEMKFPLNKHEIIIDQKSIIKLQKSINKYSIITIEWTNYIDNIEEKDKNKYYLYSFNDLNLKEIKCLKIKCSNTLKILNLSKLNKIKILELCNLYKLCNLILPK